MGSFKKLFFSISLSFFVFSGCGPISVPPQGDGTERRIGKYETAWLLLFSKTIKKYEDIIALLEENKFIYEEILDLYHEINSIHTNVTEKKLTDSQVLKYLQMQNRALTEIIKKTDWPEEITDHLQQIKDDLDLFQQNLSEKIEIDTEKTMVPVVEGADSPVGAADSTVDEGTEPPVGAADSTVDEGAESSGDSEDSPVDGTEPPVGAEEDSPVEGTESSGDSEDSPVEGTEPPVGAEEDSPVEGTESSGIQRIHQLKEQSLRWVQKRIHRLKEQSLRGIQRIHQLKEQSLRWVQQIQQLMKEQSLRGIQRIHQLKEQSLR